MAAANIQSSAKKKVTRTAPQFLRLPPRIVFVGKSGSPSASSASRYISETEEDIYNLFFTLFRIEWSVLQVRSFLFKNVR